MDLSGCPEQECRFKEAFSALSEAVKYKRESWQTWSNYAHAAVQTQNYLQAARGILQVTNPIRSDQQDAFVGPLSLLGVQLQPATSEVVGWCSSMLAAVL